MTLRFNLGRLSISVGVASMIAAPLITGSAFVANPAAIAAKIVSNWRFSKEMYAECHTSADPLCSQHFGKALMLPIECNDNFIKDCTDKDRVWATVWRGVPAPPTTAEWAQSWAIAIFTTLGPLFRDAVVGLLGGFLAAMAICRAVLRYWRWVTSG